MRHRKSGRHLNRTSAHRKAMFRNMSASLIKHELIKTTAAKAKALRPVIEPLITLAKQDTVANRRLAFARIRSDEAVAKLFVELGPRYQDRPGGYTRILKCGRRSGDAAPMAYIELVGQDQEDAHDDARALEETSAVTEAQEAEAQEAEAQEAEVQEAEVQEAKAQEAEAQEAERQDAGVGEAEAKKE